MTPEHAKMLQEYTNGDKTPTTVEGDVLLRQLKRVIAETETASNELSLAKAKLSEVTSAARRYAKDLLEVEGYEL